MSTNPIKSLWRQDAEKLLADTRTELAQLHGANPQAFADTIGIGSHLLHSYTLTMEAQERRLLRDLANPKN